MIDPDPSESRRLPPVNTGLFCLGARPHVRAVAMTITSNNSQQPRLCGYAFFQNYAIGCKPESNLRVFVTFSFEQ